MSKLYTSEQELWVRNNCRLCDSYQELAEKFNKEFYEEKSVNALQQYVTKTLRLNVNSKKRSSYYSKAEEQWLVDNFQQHNTYKSLTEDFNRIFRRDKEVCQIRDKCNKSLKLYGMNNETRYKKGNIRKQCPIGTIRKVSNGVVYIKVKDSSLSFQSGYREPYWIPIQKKIWQDNYGEVPNDKMVIFLDGDRDNIDINNLYCIDRRISVIMAKNKWYTNSRQHTLAAIKWCELFYAMKENEQVLKGSADI